MGSWWRPWQLTRHDKKEDIDSSRAMSPFILAIAILDFWWMSISRDTGSGTIKKFDLENMGIAVGILLLYVLEFEIMSGSKIPPVAGKRRQKLLQEQRLMMPVHCEHVNLITSRRQAGVPSIRRQSLQCSPYTSHISTVAHGFPAPSEDFSLPALLSRPNYLTLRACMLLWT